ncbi:hypothetical protein L9W92_11655 [Pelotomaculum terephthalicicum JT]|uniref:hypothetical protein n=1 Tax=Pelotomaculum TaxID=191373 RepID=UPI001F03EB1D|nr:MULTISPECIES: hypothetical protein [Pelotomaculum]MCG9968698.1 hypothetical protein [Pelotomaculum terephthalicicum JT]
MTLTCVFIIITDRLAAVEDLCRRALEEIKYLRSFQPQRDTGEKPEQQIKKRYEPER